MDNLNEILNREDTVTSIKHILSTFDENCKNVNFKKGIYLYGSPGCGKTHFIMDLLKDKSPIIEGSAISRFPFFNFSEIMDFVFY
jgi:predicted ATPase